MQTVPVPYTANGMRSGLDMTAGDESPDVFAFVQHQGGVDAVRYDCQVAVIRQIRPSCSAVLLESMKSDIPGYFFCCLNATAPFSVFDNYAVLS